MWKVLGAAMVAAWLVLATLAWFEHQDRLAQKEREEWADKAFEALD